MPFDPAKPANSSPTASAEMRAQLTALNADIQNRPTAQTVDAIVQNALNGTSSNTNNVATLGQSADGGYNPTQMQQVLDKLDELINTLRRF